MGKKDTAVKNFIEDNRIFADLFNGAVFEGKQIVNAGMLNKEDPEHKTMLSIRKAVGKQRDLLRRTSVKAHYVVLGVEDQSKVHYAMTVRNMLYDALEYEAQCRERIVTEGRYDLTAEEILSGIAKDTKLMPVYTVILYTGEDPWDGPRCLHDMLDIPEEMKNIVPDYPLKIVSVREWDKPELFKTELGDFFRLLKNVYTKSAEEVEVSPYIMKLTGVVSNVKTLIRKAEKKEGTEEKIMCRAAEELMEEGREEERKNTERERLRADRAEKKNKEIEEKNKKIEEKNKKIEEENKRLKEELARMKAKA